MYYKFLSHKYHTKFDLTSFTVPMRSRQFQRYTNFVAQRILAHSHSSTVTVAQSGECCQKPLGFQLCEPTFTNVPNSHESRIVNPRPCPSSECLSNLPLATPHCSRSSPVPSRSRPMPLVVTAAVNRQHIASARRNFLLHTRLKFHTTYYNISTINKT